MKLLPRLNYAVNKIASHARKFLSSGNNLRRIYKRRVCVLANRQNFQRLKLARKINGSTKTYNAQVQMRAMIIGS